MIGPVIAVDGGGTTCRVALQKGDDIWQETMGSANVSTNFDAAVSELSKALSSIGQKAGFSLDQIAKMPTFIGLAGMVSSEIESSLRDVLPFQNVVISDDRPAALRAALGASDGCLAHCGTGSFFGVQRNRTQQFSGGWGPVIGDEASANFIGKAALRAVLDEIDFPTVSSEMAAQFDDAYGGSAGIVRFAGGARPDEFGEVAKSVTSFADKGDPIAQKVMQANADHIAATLLRFGWAEGQPICLTGGIGGLYANYLPVEMQSHIAPPLMDPIEGALALAHDFAKTLEQPSNG